MPKPARVYQRAASRSVRRYRVTLGAGQLNRAVLDKALKQGDRGILATPPVMAKDDDDDAADADAKASAEACIATTCK
jgi:hypothetical protein